MRKGGNSNVARSTPLYHVLLNIAQVYSRIWRHRSTEDGERDEKLRSRTAALSVVGIGLKELLGHGSDITPGMRKALEEKEENHAS